MTVRGLVLAALALAAAATPAASVAPPRAAAPALDTPRLAAALRAADFAGTVLIARGDRIVFERAYGPVAPHGRVPHRLGQVWRWASVTKQVVATIAMQEVAAGRLDLDRPILHYLPRTPAPHADRITPRMLMQHVSGLRHTDDGPVGPDGLALFYTAAPGSPDTGLAWCEGPTGRPDAPPPAAFRYGDCDFIVMGAVLEAVTGKDFPALVQERIARPLGLRSLGVYPTRRPTVPGFEGNAPAPATLRLENYGAAGALYGTTHDMFRFDRALLSGALLPAAQRAVMWTGEPRYGYAALGQWAFETPLKGCGDTAVRIVERRGRIGGISLRNIILPDQDMVIIMTFNRSAAEEAFGEIWQQAGLTHEVLAAALCPRA